MAINKVVYDGSTLLDLTADTVTASTMLNGTKAHDKAGNSITGTVVIQKYYTGSTAPASSLGANGDIYLQI